MKNAYEANTHVSRGKKWYDEATRLETKYNELVESGYVGAEGGLLYLAGIGNALAKANYHAQMANYYDD